MGVGDGAFRKTGQEWWQIMTDIACNPITSFHAFKSPEEKPLRDAKYRRTNAFSTNVKADNSDKSVAVMKTYGTVESSSSQVNGLKKVSMSALYLNPVTCLCCGESHFIHNCQMLSNMPVEEKKRVVYENNLCFGCPRKGHNSKDCKNKSTCSICKKAHRTPLHEDCSAAADASFSHAIEAGENTSSLSCCIDRGNGGSTSMIVPMWISSVTNPETETLVYALQDTQSSNTFVDQGRSEKMGVISEPVKLKLTTIMGRDSIVQSERVSWLRIRGFASESFVNLPPTYTRDFIPLELSHIPTPETAKRWRHLNQIASEIPEMKDCEVGLLIGYDCPRALAPRQVITGGDYEPYGIKTDLGWSIVSNSSQVTKSTKVTGLCHRVSVKELPSLTPANVIRALEGDFKDTDPKERSILQDDIHFMQQLNDKINMNVDGHLEMPLPFKTRPQLPENKKLALFNLKQQERKFEKSPRYKENYVKFMNSVFEDGDAERAEYPPKAGSSGIFLTREYIIPESRTKSGLCLMVPPIMMAQP